MKPLKLVGLGNNNEYQRSYFVFELQELFKEYFNKILEKLELKDRIYEEQLPLSDRSNQIDHFKNEEFDIDVVYTQDKIILIVRAEPQNLEKFKSLILAYSKMEE